MRVSGRCVGALRRSMDAVVAVRLILFSPSPLLPFSPFPLLPFSPPLLSLLRLIDLTLTYTDPSRQTGRNQIDMTNPGGSTDPYRPKFDPENPMGKMSSSFFSRST